MIIIFLLLHFQYEENVEYNNSMKVVENSSEYKYNGFKHTK